MSYSPIEDYGIVGNLHTIALVSKRGSIDWLCFPHLNSPSLFAALLDDRRGGRFEIAALGDAVTHKQLCIPDTNVLVTRFLSAQGVGEVCDFMPIATTSEESHRHRLIRRVSVVRGTMDFSLVCRRACAGRSSRRRPAGPASCGSRRPRCSSTASGSPR
jgi:GH15 family glucan-1,4-alpha-glucosidase